MAWVAWLVLAVLLAIGELFTPGLFFLGPVALAAGGAAIASAAGAGVLVSFLVFLGCTALALGLLRPIARSHIRMPSISRTGTAALVGRTALVTHRVDGSRDGRVRIGGEEWSARAFLDGVVVEEGQTVHVVEIEGVTALVAE